MATGTVMKGPSPEARRAANERELIEYEQYIDQQLTKTARQVQGMDIATGLMCWLAGALAYLLAAASVDHWALAGGLGTWGRWIALFGLLGGSGWFLGRRVLPLLLNRINPVYSAHTIERGRPQLKNSLVNFLLLRREPRELSEAVRDALQSQAASGLAAAPVEQSIDRSPLVRFALVLLGAVLVSALYIMFSPKDPLRSAARVILPWASIERPTRFTIADIQAEVVETGRKFTGGPAEVFYGQRIKITASALNRGHVVAEPIVLRFTTADGSANDQALTLESRERNADIVLPAGTLAAAVGGGMQQSLDYTLTAGDAVAGPFHVKVLAAPSIEIESIDYEFPAYTKLPKRTLNDRGDVNALEGTRVVVRAKANQKIAQAWIDLDCDGRRDATMVTKDQAAGGNFLLALKEDRRTPVNGQYLLRFKNEEGFENPQPIRYRIDVTPDLAPEIAWESPREIDAPREQPIDEPLELMFAASDKDFELATVKLRAEVETEDKASKKPWEKSLLAKPTAEKWTSNATAFIPAEHGYAAGQTVLLWGEASDNRQPKPNVVETPKLRVTLRPPRDAEEKRGPSHQAGDTSEKKPPENGEQKEPPRDGEKQPKNGDKQRVNEGDQPRSEEQQPSDGEKKPPQAGEKQEPQDGSQDEQQSDQEEKQSGEKGSGAEENQPGGGESSEEGEEGESGQSGGKGKQGKAGEAGEEESDGEGGSGGEPSRDGKQSGKPSEKQSGEQSSGQGQGDESENGAPGEPRAGDRGAQKQARRVDPDTQDGEAFERMQQHFDKQDQSGEGKQGAKQPGEKKPTEKQSDEGQTGEKQPGAEQTGEKQFSEKQPGQEESGVQEPGAEGAEEGSESGAGENQQPDESSTNEGGDASEQEGAKGNSPKPEQGAGDTGKPEPGSENQQGAEQGKPGDQEMKPEDAQAGGEPGENGEQERAGEDQQSKGASQKPGEEKQPGNNQPSTEKQREGGAGQQSEKESQGTPEAQGQNKERDKTGQQKGTKPEEGENDPQSPSTSEHESDSRGGQGGDQSGGGEEGGGQKAKQNGTGGAGSNTEADDGANASDQSGDGETDGRGGDDQKAPGPTGDKNSQQTKGEGRQGQDGEAGKESQPRGGEQGKQGNRSGGENSKQSPSDPSGSDNESAKGSEGQGNPNGAQPSNRSNASNAEPNAGGQGDDDNTPPQQRPQQELGGDAANQDYANRATDLVLDKLKDQLKKGEPDEALLDKLQWTKQDLERFVKRWEEMKANARQPGANGKKAKDELDEALKGLGLRPRGTSTKAGKSRQDNATGIRDSRRSEPPAEYAEQYQQYNVGTSKGK